MPAKTRELFLADIVSLASTLVIKSTDIADSINNQIILTRSDYLIDKSNPSTWRYYLNISGEYHPLDTVMKVVSLDTQETIVFNKTNLNIHTATKEAYKFGTRFYLDLVGKYPNQESLILGILYPADINKAISAPNGTILSYQKDLVETQEVSLISELEERIKLYQTRYHNRAYVYSDPYYMAAHYCLLYLFLVPTILNLRLKRCHTPEAHSFHIRMFLSSHSNLSNYVDYLTLEQQLFLYRNIRYIEHNSGKQSTFEWLVDNILTKRDIPLSSYSVRHTSNFDSELLPDFIVRKKPVNSLSLASDKATATIGELYSKESAMVYGNTEYIAEHKDSINKRIKYSPSGVIQTKDLESSLVDMTDTAPYSLIDILTSYWAYYSTRGLYTSVVYFKEPITGKQLSLYSEDAFIYFAYITYKRQGVSIDTIPEFLCNNVLRLPRPSIDEFRSIVKVSDDLKDWLPEYIINKYPKIQTLYSVDSFFKHVKGIYSNMLHMWLLSYNFNDPFNIALVQRAHMNLYCNPVIKSGTFGVSYYDWLRSKNLPEYNYTETQADELMLGIFTAATGYQSDPLKDLKNIQKAMLDIMRNLSSYSMQFLQEINSKPVLFVDDGVLTPEPIKAVMSDNVSIIENRDYLDLSYKLKDIFEIDDTISLDGDYNRPHYVGNFEIIENIEFSIAVGGYSNVLLTEQATYMEISDNTTDPAIQKKYHTPGIERFLSLSETDRLELIDLLLNS